MLITLALLALGAQDPGAVLADDSRDLPTLGQTVRDVRVLDAAGRIVRRTTDAAGNEVDGDALRRAEIAARDGAAGKLSPELVARLGDAGDLEVAVWLRRPAALPDLRGVLDDAVQRGQSTEDARREALRVAADATEPGNESFARAARLAGHRVVLQDSITPVVVVAMPAGAVRAFAARADVDRAYYSFPEWYSEGATGPVFNEYASPTARTDHVHRKGVTGQGVKVLVNDTAPVALGNPYLPTLVQGRIASAAAHATAVAGIISSTHTQQTGAAPGLGTIYDWGQSGDTGAPLAWAWGMQQGISFGNCSWWNGSKGRIVFLDRYFDYIIRQFGVMLFKSIGNQGGSDGLTTTPGNGYNVTGSGCSDDRNTFDWKDDIIASFSSWVNPVEGHDKPEVAAAGTGITTTTTSSPWIGSAGSGTSYASPVTCGVAALLAATDPALTAKPEVVKAMLMAGAWQNVEGSPVLSDKDGAGGIDAAASQAAVAAGQYLSTTLTPASFPNGVFAHTLPLAAGDETRLVALWFSLADSSYATDVLQMDVDLTVEAPGGAVVASSASTRNAFEIVAFVPPVTGTYTVKLHRQRFDGSSEPLAIAWSTRRNAATDVVTLTGSGQIGTTLGIEFFDRYHPGSIYLGLASLVGAPATVPVGTKKILDLGLDALLVASPGLPGFAGLLPANGRAQTTLSLPNNPSLSGLTVHFAMVTYTPALPELFEETAGTTSVTIQ